MRMLKFVLRGHLRSSQGIVHLNFTQSWGGFLTSCDRVACALTQAPSYSDPFDQPYCMMRHWQPGFPFDIGCSMGMLDDHRPFGALLFDACHQYALHSYLLLDFQAPQAFERLG